MHIKMLLMDQGGGNKRNYHILKAQSRKSSSPSLGFFPSQVGDGKKSHWSCSSVLCPLYEVFKICSVELDITSGRVRTVQACVVNY